MTQNYLKAILALLKTKDSSSILIPCMSGWDRTPLVISLVRLSLWADGIIHQRLSPVEILYFTLAYDWMLFGHQLHDRMQKDEHIMHFAFYVLQFIKNSAFSYENIDPTIKAEENIKAPLGAKSARISSAKVGTPRLCSGCTKAISKRVPLDLPQSVLKQGIKFS